MLPVPAIEEEALNGQCDERWISEKYYVKKYVCTPDGDDYCYNVHSNKIVVVTLAPSHFILRQKIRPSVTVDFQANNINRLDNTMSGKGKRGAQQLDESSILCSIQCNEHHPKHPFIVRANLVGKLIEVNETLASHPNNLHDAMNGYIAIILPRFSDLDQKLAKLLSEEAYLAQIQLYQQPDSSSSSTTNRIDCQNPSQV